jgi:hypothetical protein
VSTQSSLFAGLLGDEAHIAFDRAAAELRTGRPIVIESHEWGDRVAALDGVTPHVYDLFRGFGGGRLVISAERAKTLGLKSSIRSALPLQHAGSRGCARFRRNALPAGAADWEPGDEPPPRRSSFANMPCCCRP